MKDLLKDSFYCGTCLVPIELMSQKVSGNLNFMKDSRKKSFFKSPLKSLKALFMHISKGEENA